MPKLITNWEDLVGLESEKYKLEIDVDMGCGWIVPKVETEETETDYCRHHYYLSTHTFYGGHNRSYTKVLQNFGFDIELDTWDKIV